jgi:DNA-directed RNA polymerase subunit RPC12/RpoP
VTVNAKKTEFICMGCWGTFSPQPDAQGDVICPHCGARQDLQHEPIDLDPDEFVDLGPELAGRVAAAASDSSTGDSVAEPGGQGSGVAPEDDDFDAVIEIDLDEIDNNEESGEPSPFTEPIPSEHVEAPAEPAPVREARPVEPRPSAESAAPTSHFHLRTERGHTYVFLAPEALILWARRLKQSQKALLISLDGVEWQPFLPFLTRLAATGQISPEVEGALGDLQRGGLDVSDEALAESLDAERHEFEVNAPVPAAEGGPATSPGDKAERRSGKSILQKPEALAVEAGPVRGVGDFTFKVDERGERTGLRYAVMLGVGVAAGAGVATALALLGLLPAVPF